MDALAYYECEKDCFSFLLFTRSSLSFAQKPNNLFKNIVKEISKTKKI